MGHDRASSPGSAPVPQPHRGVATPVDTAVRSHRSQVGCLDRLGSFRLWNAYDAQDESDADLLPHAKPPGMQLLLGHTKLESTVRYLGIEVDDALEISEQTEA